MASSGCQWVGGRAPILKWVEEGNVGGRVVDFGKGGQWKTWRVSGLACASGVG